MLHQTTDCSIYYSSLFLMFSPAKLVDYCSDTERPDHASHTEDGHSNTPHHGDGIFAERLRVTLQ